MNYTKEEIAKVLEDFGDFPKGELTWALNAAIANRILVEPQAVKSAMEELK